VTANLGDWMSNLKKVPAAWTDDCQGKKDFDGELVSLSTRYWPSGGGFDMLIGGRFQRNADPAIKPSASSTIYLGSTANDFLDDAIELVSQEFTGSTQAEVQAAVETWAAEQYGRIGEVLLREFGKA
jgi:hypothetical protein